LFTPEFFKEIAENKDYQDRLLEHLPDGYITNEGLKDSLISSQLLQALESLDSAIMTEENRNILQSLELFDNTIYTDSDDPVDAMIKTLIKKYSKK